MPGIIRPHCFLFRISIPALIDGHLSCRYKKIIYLCRITQSKDQLYRRFIYLFILAVIYNKRFSPDHACRFFEFRQWSNSKISPLCFSKRSNFKLSSHVHSKLSIHKHLLRGWHRTSHSRLRRNLMYINQILKLLQNFLAFFTINQKPIPLCCNIRSSIRIQQRKVKDGRIKYFRSPHRNII